LSPAEQRALQVAMTIPNRVPDERQSRVLLDLLEYGKEEGFIPD
jgi:hypothetical protein